MANIVYIATSIDGFIATEDGCIDWLTEIPNPNGNDYGWSEFIEGIDAIVMGRKSFEKVLTFTDWPYTTKVFVLSNTINEVHVDLKKRVEILCGTPLEITQNLVSKGFQNIYIDGGQTIQKFMDADLIDELVITTIPIVLGSGIPLFSKSDKTHKFIHKNTIVYDEQLVKSSYIKK